MAEKVLVVDDDVETLRLIGLMLQRQGYEIIAASNGTQAITLANSELPALIVLDIMMPDLDGYEVTKEIRSNPKTAHIPVMMFTARSQVDDKVIGYEVGADDYLTKPIHPAELIAHIKSLLGRPKTHAPAPTEKGYMVAVVSPRGGLGASSLALNLAISYHMDTKKEVIAAEMRPGQGTWGIDLGLKGEDGLGNLLCMDSNDITPEAIEEELTRTTYGVRLLVASYGLNGLKQARSGPHMEMIARQLQLMAPLVFLDIGACFMPETDAVLTLCDEAMLVTEPYPWTVQQTRQRIEELRAIGFGSSRNLSVVMINRIRGDLQLSASQMNDMIGEPISIGIPPAPEIAYQAGMRSAPLIMIQPDGLLARQYERLSKAVAERASRK